MKYFTNNFSILNLYRRPSSKSELVTQMIYGDTFSILKKTKKWLKIKIKEDKYKGYIKNKKYSNFLKPTHKINSLKAKIYKFPGKIKKSEISFGSKIKVIDYKSNFYKFERGWINKKNVMSISYKEKNYFKKIKLFKNIKYKWGGKSFKGIDCSALIQIFLNFNNKFCPRDARDQVKYFKKNIKLKNIKKNDIIYWKGHVAVALSSKKLIHAYGPMKKTVIMDINKTIKIIEQTAKLKVIEIKRL
jgi:cell wall-associated NlpC family hydrolase|tara:strand:+ start:3009 stop:3743 length:735 start_codon:yes stop_codon:yes gene_type:complete